jgi:hypothetical protein
MIKNYLSTGSGKEYLLNLLKHKNLNKQFHHATNLLFKETFDGVLLPSVTFQETTVDQESVISSAAQCQTVLKLMSQVRNELRLEIDLLEQIISS